MREALYHPQFGYYARKIPTVGRTGDFATSATLHPALGTAVAAWVMARRSELPKNRRWHLIELGAGTGQLAATVLESLGWWKRRHLCYHIVERSEPLRREQQSRLAGWRIVRWHDGMEAALREANGQAIIFSNEFVDAFPCVALEWEGTGGWLEIGVRWDEDNREFLETSRPFNPSSPRGDVSNTSVFNPDFTGALKSGQRVEWHREFYEWLQSWRHLWTSGAMLTIDYGDEMPGLYRRRPAGSLRGYFRHLRCTRLDFYRRAGSQDLTADVNFTDLMHWGEAFGWQNTLCRQSDFLGRWLPKGDARRFRPDPAFNFLTDPEGAGGAFRVLEQHPGQNAA